MRNRFWKQGPLRKACVLLPALMLTFGLASAAQTNAETKKKPAAPAAQDASDSAKKPADTQAPAAPASPSGPDTTTETFGDWSIVCAVRQGSTEKGCEVSSAVMLKNQTAPFARLAVVRPVKDKPARMFALVPVNVTTAAPVKILVD